MTRQITTAEELKALPTNTILIGNDNGYPRVYQWQHEVLYLLDSHIGGHRVPASVLQMYGPLEVVWAVRTT